MNEIINNNDIILQVWHTYYNQTINNSIIRIGNRMLTIGFNANEIILFKAFFFDQTEDFKSSLKEVEKIVERIEYSSDDILWIRLMIAECYLIISNRICAIRLCFNVLNLGRLADDKKNIFAATYTLLANIYLSQERYEKVHEYVEKALTYDDLNSSALLIFEQLKDIGYV